MLVHSGRRRDYVYTYIHDLGFGACNAFLASLDQNLVYLQIVTSLTRFGVFVRVTREGDLDRILVLRIGNI